MQIQHLSSLGYRWFWSVAFFCVIALAFGPVSTLSAQTSPRRAVPGKDTLEVALSSAATVDWTAGELRVYAVGLADRRAPTPDIARPAALARAQAKARELLMIEITKLPWADGKTVAEHLTATQRNEAVSLAQVTSATPQVDGGWQITMNLPLEIVRQLAQGPRSVAIGNSEPTVSENIVVDGRSLALVPALGLVISSGTDKFDCPIAWQRGKQTATLPNARKADSARDGILLVKSLSQWKRSSAASCIVVIGEP
jgi:hypothetical protein